MRLGADRSAAQSLLSEQTPLNLLQLFGRASVRSKINEKRGVLWSFVTSDDFDKTGRSPKDLPRVMEYVQRETPDKKFVALLWQEPESSAKGGSASGGKNISVLFGGERNTLEAIKSSAGGEFQSPHLALEKRFKNFLEAEEYVTSLLEGVL